MAFKYKSLGFGLGLRPDHFEEISRGNTEVDWFEALAENYMGIPGCGQSPLLPTLLSVREHHPIVLHCVSTNIGGTCSVDLEFLKNLKNLVHILKPEWVSDHLCWTGVHGRSSHELLPLPYTLEAVKQVSQNIDQVQEVLGQRFMIENTSSYMSFDNSEMTEWEFISEIIAKTDCGLLLDVNNIYVSSENHNFSAKDFIDGIPMQNVGQIHLAGHRRKDSGLIIDTHDNHICDEVLSLLAYTAGKLPSTSVMVEWDDNIPSFADYKAELAKAKKIFSEAVKK